MKKSVILSLVAFVAVTFSAVQGQNINYEKFGMEATNAPLGIAVGDDAPALTFTLQDGKAVKLSDLYQKQPVVVIFYRGYWCPVCNRYLADFAKNAKSIEDKGARIIAVTPQNYENVEKTEDKNKTGFTIVSDADGSIMKAFDVDFNVTEDYQDKVLKGLNTSIAGTNASNRAILPVPATYIIDTNGKIVYKQFDPDYRKRASVEDIVNNLP